MWNILSFPSLSTFEIFLEWRLINLRDWLIKFFPFLLKWKTNNYIYIKKELENFLTIYSYNYNSFPMYIVPISNDTRECIIIFQPSHIQASVGLDVIKATNSVAATSVFRIARRSVSADESPQVRASLLDTELWVSPWISRSPKRRISPPRNYWINGDDPINADAPPSSSCLPEAKNLTNDRF